MSRFKFVLFGAAVLMASVSASAAEWGVRVSHYSDGGFTTAGVEAVIPIIPRLSLNPNVEVSNTREDTIFSFDTEDETFDLTAKTRFYTGNLDLTYDVVPGPTRVWIGAGAAYARARVKVEAAGESFSANDSQWGTNVLLGVGFNAGPVKPYVQAKETFVSGSNTFSAGIGVRF